VEGEALMLDARYSMLDLWMFDAGSRIQDARGSSDCSICILYLVSCICAIEHPASSIEHLPHQP
jgi:hypothetical protein